MNIPSTNLTIISLPIFSFHSIYQRQSSDRRIQKIVTLIELHRDHFCTFSRLLPILFFLVIKYTTDANNFERIFKFQNPHSWNTNSIYNQLCSRVQLASNPNSQRCKLQAGEEEDSFVSFSFSSSPGETLNGVKLPWQRIRLCRSRFADTLVS